MTTNQQLIDAINQAILAINNFAAKPNLEKIHQESAKKAAKDLKTYADQIGQPGFEVDVLLGPKTLVALTKLQTAIQGGDSKAMPEAIQASTEAVHTAASTPAGYERNLVTIYSNYEDAMETPTLPFKGVPDTSGPDLIAAVNALQIAIDAYRTKGSPPVSADIMNRSNEVLVDSDTVVHGRGAGNSAADYLSRLKAVIAEVPK